MTDGRPGTGGKGQPSTTGSAVPDLLAEGLGAIARDLEQHDDPAVMLTEIVAAGVAVVPGAEEGSTSVVLGRHQVSSQAPTGDLPVQVDALQEESSRGPCMDAAYEQHTVRVDDFATENGGRCSPG